MARDRAGRQGQLLADEEIQAKPSTFIHRAFDDSKIHDVKTTLFYHPRAEPDSLLAYGSLYSGRCLEHDAHFFEEAPCSNPIYSLRSELLQAQQEDPEVKQVIAYKRWEKSGSKVGGKVTWSEVGISDETGRMMNNESKHFELLPDGLLVRLPGARPFERGVQFVPVIPDVSRKNADGRPLVDEQGRELSWRNWVMYLVHCTMATASGHMSEEDTLTVMESVVWWKGWRGFAQRWLSMCIECRERRGRTLDNVLLPGRCRQPFRMIQWDLQGPIDPPSEEGHRWIVTGVCPHIKFPVGRPLLTKTAEEVTQARIDIILEIGVFPEIHSTDLGAEFDNSLALELEAMTGSTHRFGLAWTPRFQAMVESSHKAVSAFLTIWLRALVKEFPQRWHKLLRMAFYQVQHTPITESGLTPFGLRCGWFAATPLERCLHPWEEVPSQLCLSDWNKELISQWQRLSKMFESHLNGQEELYAKMYDRRVKPQQLHPGELVLTKKMQRGEGTGALLAPRNRNLWEVQHMVSDKVAMCKRVDEEDNQERAFPIDQLCRVAYKERARMLTSPLPPDKPDKKPGRAGPPRSDRPGLGRMMREAANRPEDPWPIDMQVGLMVAYCPTSLFTVGEVLLGRIATVDHAVQTCLVWSYQPKECAGGLIWRPVFLTEAGEPTWNEKPEHLTVSLTRKLLRCDVRLHEDGSLDRLSLARLERLGLSPHIPRSERETPFAAVLNFEELVNHRKGADVPSPLQFLDSEFAGSCQICMPDPSAYVIEEFDTPEVRAAAARRGCATGPRSCARTGRAVFPYTCTASAHAGI